MTDLFSNLTTFPLEIPISQQTIQDCASLWSHVILNRRVLSSLIGYTSLRSPPRVISVTEMTANWGYFIWKLWWTILWFLLLPGGEITWHNKKKIVEEWARRCQNKATRQAQPLTSSLPLYLFSPLHQRRTFKWTQGECRAAERWRIEWCFTNKACFRWYFLYLTSVWCLVLFISTALLCVQG